MFSLVLCTLIYSANAAPIIKRETVYSEDGTYYDPTGISSCTPQQQLCRNCNFITNVEQTNVWSTFK